MPRIPYFDLDQASEEYRDMLGSRPPLNVYRMLPHAGDAATSVLSLGAALLRHGKLDEQLRELAIVRVGILNGADYEVFQHKRLARRAGIPEDKIAALTQGPSAPVYTDAEQRVLTYTDALVVNVKAKDSTFAAVAEILSHQELAELTLVIGYYMMVSRFVENFEVELEGSGEV